MATEVRLKIERIIFYLLTGACFLVQLLLLPKELPIGFEKAKTMAILLIGAVCIPILLWQFFNKFKLNNKYLISLIVVLAALFLLTLSTSEFPNIAAFGSQFRFSGLVEICIEIVIALTLFSLYTPQYNKLLIKLLLSIYFIQAIIGLDDARHLPFEIIQTGFYVNGNYGQANFFADSMLSGLTLSIFILIDKLIFATISERKRAVFLLPFILIFAIVIYLSYSYGAWTILPMMLAIIYTMFALNPIYILFSTLTFLALTVIVTLQIDPGRIDIWQGVWKSLSLKPLTGQGPDTMTYVFPKYGILAEHVIDRAHNWTLDLLYAFGVVVLLPFVNLFVLVADYIRKIKQLDKADLYRIYLLLIPILVFVLTGNVHTKSIYHYLEAFIFVALTLKELSLLASRES
jgi:O-antigen ligase